MGVCVWPSIKFQFWPSSGKSLGTFALKGSEYFFPSTVRGRELTKVTEKLLISTAAEGMNQANDLLPLATVDCYRNQDFFSPCYCGVFCTRVKPWGTYVLINVPSSSGAVGQGGSGCSSLLRLIYKKRQPQGHD